MRIPFYADQKHAVPLKRCVGAAANDTGVSTYRAQLLVMAFFEGVVAEVARGEIVRLPGIGVFAAGLRTPRSQYEGEEPYVVPRFRPARGFRAQVRTCCSTDRVRDRELRRYEKRQSPSARPRGHAQRSAKALRRFREELLARATWL